MRKNRRINDTQFAGRKVRQMRRVEVAAVRYLARDLRPITSLALAGAR